MKKLFLLLALLPFSLFAADVAKIAPADAAKLVAEGKAVLVDVREPAEWSESGVAAPALLLAKSDFDGAQTAWKPFLEKVSAAKGERPTVIVYCRSGRRSAAVAEALAKQGFTVANAGSLKDWSAAGLPTRPASEPAK